MALADRVRIACLSLLVIGATLAAGCGTDEGEPKGDDVAVSDPDASTDAGTDGTIDASDTWGVDGEGDGAPATDGGSDASGDAAADARPDALELGIEDDCNPFATTDECLFPYPSTFFLADAPERETGYQLALHDDVVTMPAGAPPLHVSVFNGADGFPPQAPILVHLGTDVDDAFLFGPRDFERSLDEGVAIALYDMESGTRIPIVAEMNQDMRSSGHEGRHPLIIRPMVPLQFATRHAVVLTAALRDVEGAPLARPAGFAAVLSGEPTDHEGLEARREALEEVVDFAEGEGFAEEDLLLAWDFVTASRSWVIGGMLSMREQALASIDAGDAIPYVVDDVIESPNEHVLAIVEGRFGPANFLTEDNDLVRRPDGTVVRQPDGPMYAFTLIIPARALEQSELPLVVFGHGIFGRGREYLTGGIGRDYIQPLAQQAGAFIVATDYIGLSSPDRDLLVNELVDDLNRLNIIGDRLQQSLVNNLTLIELVRGGLQFDDDVWPDGAAAVSDVTGYYGVSLGGIQGASLTSISRDISRAVLAVPGGNWSTMLTRSSVYAPIKTLVDIRYPDPLLQQAFVTMVQAHFDGADPVNLGRLFSTYPLSDAPESRSVLLQEAIGDCQVPNIVTRILARTLGVAQLTPSVERVWGLTEQSAPTGASVLAQFEMPDRLADYTPPDTDLVPERDNNTHSDAIRLPSAFEQVLTFFGDGVIVSPCEGACDPD